MVMNRESPGPTNGEGWFRAVLGIPRQLSWTFQSHRITKRADRRCSRHGLRRDNAVGSFASSQSWEDLDGIPWNSTLEKVHIYIYFQNPPSGDGATSSASEKRCPFGRT